MSDEPRIKNSIEDIKIPLVTIIDEVKKHQHEYEVYKREMNKAIAQGNIDKQHQENIENKRIITKLEEISLEIESLRDKVQDADLPRFDCSVQLTKYIMSALKKGYAALEAFSKSILSSDTEENERTEGKCFETEKIMRNVNKLFSTRIANSVENFDKRGNVKDEYQDIFGEFSGVGIA